MISLLLRAVRIRANYGQPFCCTPLARMSCSTILSSRSLCLTGELVNAILSGLMYSVSSILPNMLIQKSQGGVTPLGRSSPETSSPLYVTLVYFMARPPSRLLNRLCHPLLRRTWYTYLRQKTFHRNSKPNTRTGICGCGMLHAPRELSIPIISRSAWYE